MHAQRIAYGKEIVSSYPILRKRTQYLDRPLVLVGGDGRNRGYNMAGSAASGHSGARLGGQYTPTTNRFLTFLWGGGELKEKASKLMKEHH